MTPHRIGDALAAVWTQHTRSVNTDLTLVHEQAILDAAAGLVFLRERGFASIVTLGHSGGGTLYAFYLEQAGLTPASRIATTPGGRPAKLADANMPLAGGAIFLAPHPGQGRLLLACIDSSVADEQDPMSVVPELDAFSPANGFADPGPITHGERTGNVRGLHFGGPITHGERTGNELAATEIINWLSKRHELTPPA